LATLRHAVDGLSTWLLSVIATLGIPSVPIGIEYYHLGAVPRETCYVTSIILSPTFLFTAEHNFFRCCYIILLSFSIVFDIITPAQTMVPGIGTSAGAFVAAVAVLHALERFWWHVVEARPFPD